MPERIFTMTSINYIKVANNTIIDDNRNFCMVSNGNCRPVSDNSCCLWSYHKVCLRDDCNNCPYCFPKCSNKIPCWDCLHSDCSHCGDEKYPAGEVFVGINE
jgi:hypothetical protein